MFFGPVAVITSILAAFALTAAKTAKARKPTVRRRPSVQREVERAQVQVRREVRREVRRKERRAAVQKKAAKPPKPARKIPSHKVRLKEAPTELRPREAADQLYRYVSRVIQAGKASTLGTRGKPNAEVKRLQKAMGKVKADGQYGRRTRARGKELLGRDFPVRRRVIPTKPAVRVPLPPAPLPPSPEAEPEPEPQPELARELDIEIKARSPKRAAGHLLLYVRGLGSSGRAAALGYRDNPNETVRAAQQDMGELVADGIYGPNTRARGRALTGESFPRR